MITTAVFKELCVKNFDKKCKDLEKQIDKQIEINAFRDVVQFRVRYLDRDLDLRGIQENTNVLNYLVKRYASGGWFIKIEKTYIILSTEEIK